MAVIAVYWRNGAVFPAALVRSPAACGRRQAGGDTAEILYRKWRPARFSEVAGQEHVATTLRNALATGRVAHAYLFAGPRGTGKTTTGRLLAKALNCTNRQAGEPCNACESCRSYIAGRAMDLIELDAASNRGIDEIRSLRDKVAFAPGAGDFKVYLIDEVHMLTDAAFNALLKTLEEPPPHAVFVLATTEAHRLPPTIASRCQRFDFRRAPLSSMVANLQRICEGEGFEYEPGALELIARSATGSHRDAVNLLDQLVTSYGRDLSLEQVRTGLGLIGDERSGRLARMAITGDLAGGLTVIASVRDDGLELRQFQRELVDELRALLMAKSGLQPPEGATQEQFDELRRAAAPVPVQRILKALRAFGEADLKPDPNSTLPLDIALAASVLDESEPGAGTALLPADSRAAPASTPSPARTQEPRRRARQTNPTQAERAAAETSPPPAIEDAPVAPDSPSLKPEQISRQTSSSLEAARLQLRPIYERARAEGFQLGALLNSGCDIIEADDGAIVLGFRHPAHVSKASELQNLERLTAIASEVMGRPVSVRCVHAPDVEAWTLRQSISGSPLVRAAQEMGGRILSSGAEDQS